MQIEPHQDFNDMRIMPNADTNRAMLGVLRLVGLMLLAKLVVEVADALVTEWMVDSTRLWATLLLALPTLALLGVTGLFLWRGALAPHVLKQFLVVIMVVTAMQIVLRPISLYLLSSESEGSLVRAFFEGRFGGFIRSRTRLQTGMVFVVIPAVLGAWVSGQRGTWRWAALGVALSATTILVLNYRDLAISELFPFIAEDIALVLLTLFVGSLADQEREEQARLQQANQLLAEQGKVREQLAASRERVRMARDLHDTVAHSLAGLVFQLDALETLSENAPETARKALARAKGIAKQGLTDARAAITDLRAGLVDDLGLVDALRQHVEVVTTLGRVPIVFEQVNCDEPGADMLSKTTADGLFRIAQEAIHNASRHSQAKRINVKLIHECVSASSQAYLTLSVQDDGVGFDESGVQAGHYGLRGMRERAELIGAHLRVDSAVGKGTTLSVALPL